VGQSSKFVIPYLFKKIFLPPTHTGENWTKNYFPGPTRTGRANQPSPGGEAGFKYPKGLTVRGRQVAANSSCLCLWPKKDFPFLKKLN
jgi:hypothetical protein